MIVVNRSLLVARLRGDPSATFFLEREKKRGPVWVPALAAWELWRGATTRPRSDAVKSLLGALDPDAFTPAMAELAGELVRRHQASGRERPVFDLLIATHALYRNAPLATRDADYAHVEGLDVVRQ